MHPQLLRLVSPFSFPFRRTRQAASYRASLLRTPETKVSTLANGLRIATETVRPHSNSVTAALFDHGVVCTSVLKRVCWSKHLSLSFPDNLTRLSHAALQTMHKTATVGLYIDAGSRFETAANNG